MSQFQLTGTQRDTVNALAIHQDTDSLCDFIEDLVTKEVAKGAPPVTPAAPSEVEQAILKLVGKANA